MPSHLQDWYVRIVEHCTENMVTSNHIGSLFTGLRCRSKMFKNFKNIQIWRPVVNDPHKVRPCIYTGMYLFPVGIDPEGFSHVSRIRLGELPVWWSPFRIGHFALQLPYFTYVSPKFDRLVWLNYECPCIPSYRKGMYGYVEQAQKIWSLQPYWFSIYRAPMQVKNV